MNNSCWATGGLTVDQFLLQRLVYLAALNVAGKACKELQRSNTAAAF